VTKISKRPAYKYFLAGLDWVTVSAALFLAFNTREHWLSQEHNLLDVSFVADMSFIVCFGAASILIFQYYHLYKVNIFTTVVDHAVRIVRAVFTTVAGIALLSFFTKAPWVIDSRLAVALFIVVALGLSVVLRLICFRWLFLWLSRRSILHRTVLVVGAGPTGKSLAMNIHLRGHDGLSVIGFLDDDLPVGQAVFGGAKVEGRIADLRQVLDRLPAREIIVCLDNVDHGRMMEVVEAATKTGARVKISSPLYDIISSRVFTEEYGGVPVVNISHTRPSPLGERRKRLFDVVLGAALLVVLSPVLLLIAVLVVVDSPGPVLFRQTRIGKNGTPFTFYKFRSMLVGSDRDETRKHLATQFVKGQYNGNGGDGSTKIVNEAQVTRVGKWLRKTSLDELPQLLNVLRGEMSLVGPRPCLPYEWEHYEEWHKQRLSVLPGCTGMWQVSGRSAVGFDDMVVLDLHYIHNASLLLDLRLLVKTVPIIVWGTGAK